MDLKQERKLKTLKIKKINSEKILKKTTKRWNKLSMCKKNCQYIVNK